MRTQTGATQARELMGIAAELLRAGQNVQAVAAARRASRLIADPVLRAINLGGVLIDGGGQLKNLRLVREGTSTLRGVLSQVPASLQGRFHYNLGTGYLTVGQHQRGSGPGTRPALADAVTHFDEALRHEARADTRVNLGNALFAQGRWVEAIDEFTGVLDEHPGHHVALAGRAAALVRWFHWTGNHTALLAAALADYERAAILAAGDPVYSDAYRRAAIWLRRRRVKPHVPAPPIETLRRDSSWIWESGLALNPCPLCRVESPDAFDMFPLARHLRGGRRVPRADDLLDVLSSICRTFGTARWMLYKAMADVPAESDHVITLRGHPRAAHNLATGLLMVATHSFFSVLSQVSFALNSHFQLGHEAHRISIGSVWRLPGRDGRIPQGRAEIHPRLRRRAVPALSALYQLAVSFERGLGRYAALRDLRNHLEHHAVVALECPSTSGYYVAVNTDRLRVDALQMGRLARAAIWYFGGALLQGERERLIRTVRRGGQVRAGVGDAVRRV